MVFTGCRVDGTLTVHDAETYEQVGTVNVIPDGDSPSITDPIKAIAYPFVNEFGGGTNYVQDLDVSPDGRTVYVARGHMADVVELDLETGELGWRAEMAGFRADHQTISDDGRYVFTADTLADKVWKIDTETGEKVEKAEVTDFPHGNHLHDVPGMAGTTLVNGSLGNMLAPDWFDGDHRLTFMDASDLSVRRIVDFEEGVRPFVFGPDARKIYVQISYLHGFHEYDVVEDRITRTKHLPQTDAVPEDEDDYPLQSAHHGIDMRPDGEYLCIAGTTSHAVFVVRLSDLQLLNTIRVGSNPYWVQNAPDGEHAFVAVKGEDTVSVINYERAEEVAEIAVDADPMVMETRPVPESILSGL